MLIGSPLHWRHNDLGGVSNHQPHDCLLNRLFTRRSKKTPKLRITGLCVGNSPGTGEFPAQRASNAENVSIMMTSSWCISLSCGPMPARPPSLVSVVTKSDPVFLGLPFSLGLGSGQICPYHLSCPPLQRTAVSSLMPSFLSDEAEGVLSWTLVPQIQRIMERSLW